jgi:HlyD family secretion protein
VLDVHNPEGKLKPGMTASVTATTEQRDNVLTVPNAAFRFRPEGEQAQAGANTRSRTGGGPAVYRVGKDGALEPVAVRSGLTDGSVTEVVGGTLREGDVVAVPATANNAAAGRSQAASPFSPVRPRGGGRR